jgi:hypothetical protein
MIDISMKKWHGYFDKLLVWETQCFLNSNLTFLLKCKLWISCTIQLIIKSLTWKLPFGCYFGFHCIILILLLTNAYFNLFSIILIVKILNNWKQKKIKIFKTFYWLYFEGVVMFELQKKPSTRIIICTWKII